MRHLFITIFALCALASGLLAHDVVYQSQAGTVIHLQGSPVPAAGFPMTISRSAGGTITVRHLLTPTPEHCIVKADIASVDFPLFISSSTGTGLDVTFTIGIASPLAFSGTATITGSWNATGGVDTNPSASDPDCTAKNQPIRAIVTVNVPAIPTTFALPQFGGLPPIGTPPPPMTNTNLPTGANGSNGVATLDCNGDGVPDLITSNRDGSISTFIGNPDNSYQAPIRMSLGTGVSPQWIAAGDINGDGKSDLVVAASPPNTVIRLLGNGSCGFAVQSGISGVGSPYFISIVDVNGDGLNDIIVSDMASNKINVLLGSGNGAFGSPISSVIGTKPYVFTAADLNGDGRIDLAVADPFANGIWVAAGNGLGNFTNPQFFATGQSPSAPAVGDINGDGKPDLAVANNGSNTVYLFLNNFKVAGGALSFLPPTVISLPAGTGPGSPLLTMTPGGDKQDQLVVPGVNANNIIVFNYLSPSLFQTQLGLPFNPAFTVYSVGLDPVTVIPTPGAGLAAPGQSGLNLLTPDCPVSVSPQTLYFGPNPPVLIPGLEAEVNVPPFCPWTSSVTFNGKPVDYATVTPSSGVGPATVLVQMAPNTTSASRGARITFSSGSKSSFTFAYQAAAQSVCADAAVDTKSISVGVSGGTTTVNVTVPVTSDGCNSSAAASDPSITVSPTDIAGSNDPIPITFTVPANPGDTLNFYGFVGPNIININSTGLCVPLIGPFDGTIPSSGVTLTIPITILPDCTITPKAAGLGATASRSPDGVQVTIPATSAANPLTGSVTIGNQVLPFVQKPLNPTQLFTDVPLTHPYVDSITVLQKLFITSGCGSSTFCPDDPVSRGQMAVWLVRSVESGDNFQFNPNPYFADVQASNPYFRYIQRLKELGVTTGCDTINYCPDDMVTRGQMAVFLIRAKLGVVAGTPIPFTGDPYFADTPIDPSVPLAQQAYPFIQQMRALGITSGCSTTTYCPDDLVTRGQLTEFLVRSFLIPAAGR